MKKYKKKMNVIEGTMSEKFDGIQGIWDGKVLRTRTNNIIHAPFWWLKELPKIPLTGELWTKRNDFSNIQSIVTSNIGDDRWVYISYMIFGIGDSWINPGKYGYVIPEIEIESQKHFEEFYMGVISNDGKEGYNGRLPPTGEGIVIIVGGVEYKRKPLSNDDGQIIGYTEGTGKYLGMTGALIIKLRDGRTMKLSGMNDSLRQNPPAIGAIIEFIHWGRTSTGLPRFAAFDRVRMETNLNF